MSGIEFIRRTYENGKLTIPKEIRDLHGIRDGDYVRVVIVGVVRAEQPGASLPAPKAGPASGEPSHDVALDANRGPGGEPG